MLTKTMTTKEYADKIDALNRERYARHDASVAYGRLAGALFALADAVGPKGDRASLRNEAHEMAKRSAAFRGDAEACGLDVAALFAAALAEKGGEDAK